MSSKRAVRKLTPRERLIRAALTWEGENYLPSSLLSRESIELVRAAKAYRKAKK